MRPWLAPLALSLTLLLPAPGLCAAPELPLRVLKRLPHDPEAFTEGLLLHKGALFESTGLYGQSSLRRVDPGTGRVLARANLKARLFGEGLALCPEGADARLVQLTWREGFILTYDAMTLRPTGRQRLRGEGWGLACRGDFLMLSDGTDVLRWLDARSLAETGESLRVRDGSTPVRELNELEWVNGWLVANIWRQDRLAVVHPRTGQVAAWLDLAPLRRELSKKAEVANGVAFDPAESALYLTGKRWGTVFVVELPELLRRPPPEPAR